MLEFATVLYSDATGEAEALSVPRRAARQATSESCPSKLHAAQLRSRRWLVYAEVTENWWRRRESNSWKVLILNKLSIL